jgi:hypothetical protein
MLAIMKRALVPVLAAVALAGVLAYQLFTAGAVECKVCVNWKGMSRCATSRGETEGEARGTAQDSACSLVARGVSEAMQCPRQPPTDVVCKAR